MGSFDTRCDDCVPDDRDGTVKLVVQPSILDIKPYMSSIAAETLRRMVGRSGETTGAEVLS